MSPSPHPPYPSSQSESDDHAHRLPPNSNSPDNFPLLTPGRFLLLSSIPLGLGAYFGYRRALRDSLETPTANGNSLIDRMMMHPESPAASMESGVNPAPSSSKYSTTTNTATATATTSIHNNTVSMTNHYHQSSINGTSNASKRIVTPSPTPLTNTIPPAALATRALAIGSLLSLSATSLLVAGLFLVTGSHSLEELVSKAKTWAPEKLNNLQTSLGVKGGNHSEEKLDSLEYERAVRDMTEEEEWDYFKGRYGRDLFGAWDNAGGGDDAGSETNGK